MEHNHESRNQELKKRQKLHFEQSWKCKNHEVIVAKYNEDPYHVYTVGSKDDSRKSQLFSVKRFVNKSLQA